MKSKVGEMKVEAVNCDGEVEIFGELDRKWNGSIDKNGCIEVQSYNPETGGSLAFCIKGFKLNGSFYSCGNLGSVAIKDHLYKCL